MNDAERVEKLKSAKQKLKAFRAKKGVKRSSRSSTSSEEPVASTSRVSIEGSARKTRHSHKKSSSRQSIPPAQPTAVALSRRNSRHSRTESICNVHTMVTEIAQPAVTADGFTTWQFPRSPSVPSSMSPDMGASPFASGSRHLQPRRASLQHPPLSPSAGSAVVQSTGALSQRRTSLQPEVLSSSLSPAFVSTPIMPSLSGVMSGAHTRRNSRHSRKLSIGSTRESFEIMSGHAFNPAEASTPETDRTSALEVLEGRSPTIATVALPQVLPDLGISALPPATNKRSSWSTGMTASASSGGIAQAGGRGAVDLGMLVEEEEEDQSDVFEPQSDILSRRRPQSLYLPSPSTLPHGDGTTSDTLSPTEELMHPFSSTPARGYRPLSMMVSPTTTMGETGKRAGLRSLALSHGASSASVVGNPNQRRSLMSSTGSASSSRRMSTGPSSAVGKRTSISYRSATPASRELMGPTDPDVSSEHSYLLVRIAGLESDISAASAKQRVLEAEVAASQAILTAKEIELSTVHAKMASLQAELQSHGNLGTRVVDLEAQLAEADERFAAELDGLQERCKEAELERDDLKEDVEGWRARCADLARNVDRERTRVEEERKESATAREQVRKLGERLAAASSTSAMAKANADEALAEAQGRLIAEMRDQIFSLAGQLERERAAHSATQALLTGQPSPTLQEADDEAHNVFSDGESDAGSSVTSNSAFEGRRSLNTTADASFSTLASEEIPPSRPVSFSQSKLPEQAGVPITLGGLQTLAEEEEEETEEEEPMLPMLIESSPAHGQGSGGSTCSTASDAMPKTPLKETPPAIDHDRSHSFLKNWKFPMGSVEQQVHIVNAEDSSFFGISQAEVLPPLAVSAHALELPPFALSDLVVDPDWQPSAHPQSLKSTSATRPEPPVAKAKGPSRLSLANFGNLISSYVAPPPAPAPKAATKQDHGRRDSLLFAGEGDSRPPLLLARSSGTRKTIKPSEAKRPVPGPLAELDFSSSCACRSTRIMRI